MTKLIVNTAIKIGKVTRKIVWQNITMAMTVIIIVLIMGVGGIATLWEAVFALWCSIISNIKCSKNTKDEILKLSVYGYVTICKWYSIYPILLS